MTKPEFTIVAPMQAPINNKKRRLIREQVAASPLPTLFFEVNCFAHQAHLLVGNVLAKADTIMTFASEGLKEEPVQKKFFTALGCVMNVWREIAQDVFFCWKLISPVNAAKHGHRMPSRCIGGRWGSVAGCLDRLLQLPREEFKDVFNAALMKKKERPKSRKRGEHIR